MSYMFEVYYRPPANPFKEATLTKRVEQFGGRLDFREEGEEGVEGICLTYEFDELEAARVAADELLQLGEHVEGPVDYGDDQ